MQSVKEESFLKKEELLKSLNLPVLHRYEFDAIKRVPRDTASKSCKICGMVHIDFSERLK